MTDRTIAQLDAIAPLARDDQLELSDTSAAGSSGRGTLAQLLGLLQAADISDATAGGRSLLTSSLVSVLRAAIGLPLFVTKADQTLSATSLTDITDGVDSNNKMSWAVVDGRAYSGEIFIDIQSPAQADGFKLAITKPSGDCEMLAWSPAQASAQPGSASGLLGGFIRTNGTAITFGSVPEANANIPVLIKFKYRAANTGTLRLQMAAENAASPIVVKAGGIAQLADYGPYV